MRKFYLLSTLVLALFYGQATQAQDFSNKGREFWISSGWHYAMGTGSPPQMTLSLTSDVNTTYTIEAYGVGVFASGAITANQVTNVNIPSTYFTYNPSTLQGDGLFNGKAIHVTAIKPIVVYSFTTQALSSAATLCLPTNVLGKEYYAASYTQLSANATGNNFVTVVAVEDNTTVEIIPTRPTAGGWAANSVNTVTLNKGQIYQVLGQMTGNSGSDLTGTSVRSIASASGSCKRIAVFSGSGRVWIPNTCGNGADNLYQQLYPISTWGRKYLTVPSADRNLNYYRIITRNPSATSNIRLNGVVIPPGSFTNKFYEFSNSTPNLIEADSSISVVQYFTSAACVGNQNPYDPDMVVLNPVEQNIADVTLISSDRLAHTITPQHYIHVIMKNSGTGIPSFRFDGVPIPPLSAWVTHPQDPSYSYLYLRNISETYHSLKSDSGFNAIAYGYATNETYAYSAGTNVKDLYQQIGITSQYGIESTPSICKGSPFKFKVSLPYCVDSIKWDLSGLPPPTPANPPTQIYANCASADSSTLVNGVTIYWYSIPSFYAVNTSGTFPITITTYSPPTGDGCGTEQEISFDLTVYDPPVADFSSVVGGCPAEAVTFQDNTVTPKPSYLWFWDFGDPASGASNTSGLQNPSHVFSGPGTYNVKFSTITTPGCISQEIIKQVVIPDLPSGSISGTATVCINDNPGPTITFSGTGGKPGYTFTYNIDNGSGPGPNQTISTTGTNTSVTLQAPTNVAGTFRYNLVQIKNTGSTLCLQNITNTFVDVIVRPDATISLSSPVGTNNQTVCVNTAITPITYAIGGSGNNGTFTSTIPGVTGVYSAGVLTITGTPTVAGTYPYTVTTQGPCQNPTLNGTITVTDNATINLISGGGTDDQTVCINTTITNIIYSVGGSGTGATITFTPALPGVTGVYNGASRQFTISGTPTAAGVYNYTIQTAGPCVKPSISGRITVTGDATIALTSAAPTTSQTICVNHPLTSITYAVGGTATGGTVTFLPGPITGITANFAGGVITISGTPTVSGNFTYIARADGPCAQPQLNGSITIRQESSITLTSAPATENQKLCRGTSITNITYAIGGSGTGGAVVFTPALPGVTGVYSGGVVTISGTPTAAGVYNYTVNPAGPCVETSESGTITVDELPVASFTHTLPACDTRVIQFTNTSIPNAAGPTQWFWDFGDPGSGGNNTSTIQDPTHVFTNPSPPSYTVTLRATNSNNCISAPLGSAVVTVNVRPQADFSVPEVCIGDAPTVFPDLSTVSSGGWDPAGYFWNFGDPASGANNTANTKDGTHLFTVPGNYTIMHVATTALGCKDTVYHDIFVNAGDPNAAFNVMNLATLCSSDTVSIVNQSTVSAGSVIKLEVYWDVVNNPGVFQTFTGPLAGDIYKHKYPTLQTTQNYTVRMVAYSGVTCFDTEDQVLTVHATPKVQFNAMPDACLDAAPFQITQASEIGGVVGTGTYSGPGVSSSGIFNPASVGPGTYLIKYTFTSTAAGCIDTLTMPITVLDSASAQFTFSPVACEKRQVDFSSASSTIPAGVGTITGWTWDFGDPASGAANTSTLPNPSHTYYTWGTYNVTLYVTTSNGCKSTLRTIPVTVNPLARPNFTLPPSACLPSANITFNNTSTIPDGTESSFTFLWNFDDPPSGVNNTSTGSSPSHIYNAVGPYNVNLQVTSGAGCVHDTTIVLNTIHPEPVGAFTVNKNDVCIGQSFTFTDNSNPADGSTVSWTWNMDDGNTRTTPSFTYTYTTAGEYDVTMYITNSHGCRSSIATRTVTVNAYPIVNAGPDLFILQGGKDTLQPIVTAVEPTYLWTPNTYFNSSNTIKNAIVNGVEDIIYTLTVTGKGDCKASDQVFIKVLKGPEIPNIFSPNGDGIHDRWEIKYLDTYPEGTVEIYNRYGQMIWRSTGYNTPWDGKVNGKDVPVGTYYYIVNPKNGRAIMSGYVDVIR